MVAQAWFHFGLGLTQMLPGVTVALVGREAIFNTMARRFDRNRERMERDGAFISGKMIDTRDH